MINPDSSGISLVSRMILAEADGFLSELFNKEELKKRMQEEFPKLLFLAVENGKKRSVLWLLENGANPNQSNEEWTTVYPGSTVLLQAIDKKNLEIVESLVNKGANVNSQERDSVFVVPLFYAICNNHIGMVEFLIGKGATLNVKDLVQMTPLIYAVRFGDIKMVGFILSKKPDDINTKDVFHYTALHHAVMERKVDIVKFLSENGANQKRDYDNFLGTPYEMARRHNYHEMLKYLEAPQECSCSCVVQ
jgi:ankyrin repeat protein